MGFLWGLSFRLCGEVGVLIMVFIVGVLAVLLGCELFLMCSDVSRDVGDVLLLCTGLVVGLVVVVVFSH